MRLSVRARAQNALFRRVRFSSPAQTWSHLTQRRILRRRSHAKAQSAPGDSRKSALCAGDATATWPRGAFWAGDVTERRILRVRLDQRARSTCDRWLRREAIFADLCTLLHTHGRSRDRAGPRAPRRRGPRGPRDAQVPGPEVHATGAVTQPSTHTNSRSLRHNRKNRPITRGSSRGKHSFCVSLTSSP